MKLVDKLVVTEKENLAREFNEKHNRLIATTEVLKQTLMICRQNGWENHAALWNIAIYLNIAGHDLSILVQQLHFERETWARKQIARHVVLAIYEITEDMTQLLGKKIREPLEKLGLLTKFEKQIGKVRKPLNEFWNENQESMQEIRCMSAAHRDHDGLALLEAIDTINVQKIAVLGLEINKILIEIGNLMQIILTETSQVEEKS